MFVFRIFLKIKQTVMSEDQDLLIALWT